MLVVSSVVPPSPSGQAVMLGRLLDESPFDVVWATPDGGFHLTGRSDVVRLRLARFHGPTVLPGPVRHVAAALRTLYSLLHRVVQLTVICRRRQIDVMVACTASPIEISAGVAAARLARCRSVAYLFDDPVFQWPAGPVRRVAALGERWWRSRVDAVVVPNENMRDEFERRAGRGSTVVRNPVPDLWLDRSSVSLSPRRGPVRIVYTGAVYSAQADALQNVARAIEQLPEALELHLYTSEDETSLRRLGLGVPHVVVHPHVDGAEVLRVQREADVLVLPLAFKSPIPEVIASSAPGKFGEYLASGRPVLVHAPADSWVVDFADNRAAAVTVATDDPSAVAAALRELLGDPERSRALAANGLAVAELFRASTARRILHAVIVGGSDAVAAS